MKKTHLLFILLAGCSASDIQPQPESTVADISGTVYLAKSSLLRPPVFEQHVLRNGKLFSECGTIRNGKVIIEEQKMSTVDSKRLNLIKKSAIELQDNLKEADGKFRKLESSNKIFDQGIAKISIELDGSRSELKTNLSAISDPLYTTEIIGAKFVRKLRKSATASCGRISFFGIQKG